MSVNDLTFNQLSTVLNDIVAQATGKTSIAPINSTEFVSVAQTVLKQGYDPLLNAVSQVLSKTIFSTRPYSAKFAGLRVSEQRYGNITRKLNISDKDFTEDNRFKLVDGQSVDMYKVNKPSILQTNFYGANVFSRYLTLFKDQFDCAFSNEAEFGSFIAMVMQNASDLIEQGSENVARATLANFIGGKIAGDNGSVVHLITEYNNMTGSTLTFADLYQADNYVAFMRWAYAFMANISEKMTERSIKYQINVTGKPISRHTPKNRQKMYINTFDSLLTGTVVLSTTFNDDYLKGIDYERVNFWQSIDSPTSLNVEPVFLKPDGTLDTTGTPVTTDKLFAVLFDEEALGISRVNTWSAPTPFNADGGYSNVFWHWTERYWNDFTEKGVVFLLD